MGEAERFTPGEFREDHSESFLARFIHRAESAQDEFGGALAEQVQLFRELVGGIKEGGWSNWKDLDAGQKKKVAVYGFRAIMGIIGAEMAVPHSAEAQEAELGEPELTLEPDQDGNIDIELHVGYEHLDQEDAGEALVGSLGSDKLGTYKDFARQMEGFDRSARGYLNTRQDLRYADGRAPDANKDYYYIPVKEVASFMDGRWLDEDGSINKNYKKIIAEDLQPILSEDGQYYIFPKDVQEYDSARQFYKTTFYLDERQDLALDAESIKERIFVDMDRTKGFGLSVPEMRDAIYGTLQSVRAIDITAGDIKDFNWDDKSQAYFAVSDERRRDVEQEFLKTFQEETKNFSEEQKLASLSILGDIFLKNYDDSVRDEGIGGQGEVPLSELLMAAKARQEFGWQIPSGVCRQINQKLPEIAERALGMEGFTKNTYATGMHVIGGVRLKDGTLALLDYGDVIRTNTSDQEKAASFYERHTGRIEGESRIGDEKGDIKTAIKSRATQSREKAMHYEPADEKVERLLENGKILETPEGLVITAENEKQELAVNREFLVASMVHLDKSADQYNALDGLYGVRLGVKDEYQYQSFHISATVLAEQLKRLEGGTTGSKELAQEFGWDMARRFNLSERASIAVANTLNAYMVASLDHMTVSGGGAADSFGARFSYINPEKPLELHVGAREHVAVSLRNIQTGGFDKDGIRLHRKLAEIDIAARVPVSERLTVGVAATEKFGDIYRGRDIAASVEAGGTAIRGSLERETSKDLLFLPHNQKGEIEITHRAELAGRQSIVTLYGSRTESDYGGQKSTESRFTAGISMLF